MRIWTIERGTLWALQTGNGLPPLCPARVEVAFAEAGGDDIEELAAVMNLPAPEPLYRRLQSGRRCFILRVADRNNKQGIAAYGWVTRGVECVGELERKFHLHDDEVYIWDCGTALPWRGRRLYSALLTHIIYHFHHEGVLRLWIGASLQNRPSIQGFVNAGFQPVVDCTYGRFYRLTLLWIRQAPSAQRPLVSAAYRVLLNKRERRLGPFMIGYIGNRQP
jgi:GNAT superfamily N-acetyltransferase